MVILVFSCKNRPQSKSCIDNASEELKISLEDYFSSHSHALVLVINPTDVCELCVLNLYTRLSYLNNKKVQVFIFGLDDNSDVPTGFIKFPNDFENTSELKSDKPYLCIVDSSFIASQYFIPEFDKPHLLENYLKDIIPILSEISSF
jgi:hypothetical protein